MVSWGTTSQIIRHHRCPIGQGWLCSCFRWVSGLRRDLIRHNTQKDVQCFCNFEHPLCSTTPGWSLSCLLRWIFSACLHLSYCKNVRQKASLLKTHVLTKIPLVLFLDNEYDELVWMPLVAIEFTTLLFTLQRTYMIYKRSYGRKIVMSSLLDVIIRDNILYFIT